MKLKDEFVKGSLVFFILFNIFNFLNYLFQFSMARMMSVVEYGTFSVLMSIIYILNVPSESIQLTASKYSAEFHEKKELGKLKRFIFKSTKKAVKYSFTVFLLFIPLSFFLSWFLNISVGLILATFSLVFFTLIIPINRGILQGEKNFIKMGLAFFSESLAKILFGVFLVLIGWKIYGAIAGIFLGFLFSFIFSFLMIKDILKAKEEKIETKNINSYSFWVFFVLFIIFFMLSIDVPLAKRFFSPETVGIYAIISLLGKTIFFATMPISKVMFPITSGKEECNSKKTLYDAIKIVCFFGALVILLFYLVPGVIITTLFGSKYLIAPELLWISGLAYLFLSLSNLNIYYLLSLKKLKTPRTFMILLIFPVAELILLSLFNTSLLEFVISLLASFVFLFLGSLLIIKYGKTYNNNSCA